MNSQVSEHSATSELLSTKEREVERLREDLENNEIRYDSNIKELRQAISDMRREMSGKAVKEEELRRRIR